MTDFIVVDPTTSGTTRNVATDRVAGVDYQIVKQAFGADGSVTPVSDADPMPVELASVPLPTGASTEATLAALKTAVDTLNVAAAAIETAVEALNTKTTAVNTGAIAGAVTVTGVATAANQTTGNASLASIDGKLTSPVGTRINSYAYPISTGNSSTAQLAAGATFTGTIESPQDQPSISILLTSDQPTTITVRQFIDVGGTFAAPDIVFYVEAGAGFSRSLAINGNFVRVLAQNTGASTTTTFNLNVAYGTLGDADAAGVQPITELSLVLRGAAAQTAVVNNILNPAAGTAALDVGNYRSASVQVVSTGTGGTFIFEQSNDNVNYVALPVFNSALVTGVPITAAITASASAIVYTIPLRCRFLRLRIVTTITGGSIQAFSRVSTEPWTATAQLVASNTAANLLAQVSGTVTANLGAATTRAGFLAGAGIWYDDSATNLGASATFTGTSRDLTLTATATAFANAATYAQELRVGAESDVTGTLWLEVSRDNTNWRRIKSVATAAVTGGGFYAEIVHAPSWRYARVGYTNGAGAQARFSIGSITTAL